MNPTTRYDLEDDDDGGPAVVEARRLVEVLADRISDASNPSDFTVSVIADLAARVGLVVHVGFAEVDGYDETRR